MRNKKVDERKLWKCETWLWLGPTTEKDLWPMGWRQAHWVFRSFFIYSFPSCRCSCWMFFTFVPALFCFCFPFLFFLLAPTTTMSLWIRNSASCSQLVTTTLIHPNTNSEKKRKTFPFPFYSSLPHNKEEKHQVSLSCFIRLLTRWHLVCFPVSLVIMPCWDLVPHWSFSLSVSFHVVVVSLLAAMSVPVTFHSHCLLWIEQCGLPGLRRSWNFVRESFQLLGRDAIRWVSLWPKFLPFVENVLCFAEWGLFNYAENICQLYIPNFHRKILWWLWYPALVEVGRKALGWFCVTYLMFFFCYLDA